MKSNTKFLVILTSVLSIVLVLFIAVNANRYIARMSANNSELYSAFRISELMRTFRSTILIMENKQRGYMVKGDPVFLQEYKVKEYETKALLKSMEKYFSGKPEEELFYKLKEHTYSKLANTSDLSHAKDGLPGTKKQPEQGLNSMTELHQLIDAINISLSSNTKQLLTNSTNYVNESKNWSYLEIAIGLFTLLSAALFLFRDINTRNKLEKELKAAKQRADQNAMMKDQFMANMSHEIRTPMNAILGFLDLLRKTELAETQKEYVSAIKISSSNLLNIINDILDFSKIEAGQLKIERIPFSISNLMESLNPVFKEKAAEKNIELHISLDPSIPLLLFGDPTRLMQILVNLLSNAIKFTDHGSVSLICAVKSIEHDMAQLVIRVKDTGIGIPDDKINYVFERFNQGNASTTRKFGGTGLGLAIVKNLVEIQNGDIAVSSKEGFGTEFTIIISYPVAYENVAIMPEDTNQTLAFSPQSKFRILLAEDNLLNQKLALTYLNGFGLDVEIAENGQVAIDKMVAEKYDLVLMDIQMPVLDGYQATKHIREKISAEIPIVAMTANTMEGEREKCLSLGMNDYLSKPFTERELYTVISKYLKDAGDAGTEAQNVMPYQNPGTRVVDLEQIFSLSRGNNKFVKEMIDIFLEQNPKDLVRLEKAMADNNREAIRSVAHKMKTSLGFMGMRPLMENLTIIEKSTDADMQEQLRIVKEACHAAVKELTEVIHDLKLNSQ